MQLEDMSTAELIALVKRQEQELSAAKAEGAVSKAFSDLMTFGTGAIQVTHIPYEDMLLQPVQQPVPVANIALPGCLADRLYEAISIAHDRAQHAGSTQRMKKWDATRADLRAALAAPVAAPVTGQEPTKAMLAAGWECMPKEGEARSSMDYVYYIYMAMQRAAPVPAASVQPDPLKCGTTRADRDAMRAAQPDSGRDAALVDEADLECQVPPHGWRCTRGAGHSGPCAAVECPEDIESVKRGMERLAAHPANVAQPVSDKSRAAIHRKVLERGMDGPDVVGPTVCTVPPAGWYCTRAPGHDGPCAAHPSANVAQVGELSDAQMQNLGLIIIRLERISANSTETPRELADEALVLARTILAAAKKGS